MSSKNLPTLRGVFPPPKVQPKRDFLRENKLKLKDLQKHLINRKQLEQEIAERNSVRSRFSNHNIGVGSNDKLQSNSKDSVRPRRSASVNSLLSERRRVDSSCSNLSAIPVNNNIHCLCSNARVCVGGCQRTPLTHLDNYKVMAVHCDKQIQTDDILDQTFLSEALKRCCSVDTVLDDEDIETLSDQNDNHSTIYPLISQQLSNKYKYIQPYHNVQMNDKPDSALPLSLDNLEINQKRPGTNQSIQTSVLSRKINRTKLLGAPDFGNRSDIKLPKYLEKEKRERELQKYRDMEKDHECPEGHILLNEQDRLDALEEARKSFRKLVAELNHMPMSSETLRTRTRKNEIEKALVNLENEIRTYSKQKVYVKSSDTNVL